MRLQPCNDLKPSQPQRRASLERQQIAGAPQQRRHNRLAQADILRLARHYHPPENAEWMARDTFSKQHRASMGKEALSCYTTHRARLDYPAYRARGLQIGSGTIESACKQLVSACLKLAGMIWDAEGAEAVAVVRAWLKSDCWNQAMRLRPPPRRPYRRQAASAAAA